MHTGVICYFYTLKEADDSLIVVRVLPTTGITKHSRKDLLIPLANVDVVFITTFMEHKLPSEIHYTTEVVK